MFTTLFLIGIFSLITSIQFFTSDKSAAGIFFIFLGIILIIIAFFQKKTKENKECSSASSARISNDIPPISFNNQLRLAQELLISYYMDLAQEMAGEMEESDREAFESKFPKLKLDIANLIDDYKGLYGTTFLTEDSNTNETSKKINQKLKN